MAKYRAILLILVLTILLYVAHSYILSLYSKEDLSYFLLSSLYVFFGICAAIILFAVHLVHSKKPDVTGYVFIGGTLVQMGLSYIMLKPVLGIETESAAFDRGNFFIIFVLFLAIETILTARLLNNKQ